MQGKVLHFRYCCMGHSENPKSYCLNLFYHATTIRLNSFKYDDCDYLTKNISFMGVKKLVYTLQNKTQ